jgi:tetratricopeptide (TPR) repeat protein
MNHLLLFLLLFIFTTSEAQNFAEEHYRFDTNYKTMKGYYHRGLYHKAVEHVDSLNNNRFVDKHEFYLISRIYSLNNQFDKALFYLEKAVRKGITKKEVETLFDFDKFREHHLYLVFNLNYDKWHNEYLQEISKLTIDSFYYHQLINMHKASLDARKYKVTYVDGDEMYEKYEEGDSLLRWKAEIKQDSINFYQLAELIQAKGFPTTKKVGDAFETATFILKYKSQSIEKLNEPNKIWQQISASIEHEMKEGNLSPNYLALLTDISKSALKLPQVYLTFLKSYYCKDNENCIENPKELNVRRRLVGLCSIELDFWVDAIDFPKEIEELLYKKE